MVPSQRSENGKLRVNAGILTALMIMLPWSTMTIDVNDEISSLDDNFGDRSTGTRSWGEVGYNDTGWIELSATGADPTNGTPAYGNLMLDFAPGAVIDNLTLEVSVNGSDGYWIEQPQMALLNTQTGIFDWSERGGFGRQNDFFESSTGIVDGVLDTSLQPNSNSDASWQIPTGIEITDLVIEALRPVDPKLSLTPLEVNIHDSAVNPIDGRLYLLVDEDLLHLDDSAIKRIIDFTPSVEGKSLATDGNRGILYIGDIFGNVSAMRLNDSAAIIDLPSDVIQNNS